MIRYKKHPLLGRQIKRLLVLKIYRRKKGAKLKAYCRCSCGNKVRVRVDALKDSSTQSCGCLRLEAVKRNGTKVGAINLKVAHKVNTIHGESNSIEHTTLHNMLARCYNKKNPQYKDYGGRGIRVCKRWRKKLGILFFIEDMGRRPGPEYSIDRWPDNDGNYEPDNCRWATKDQQSRNKGSSINKKDALVILSLIKHVSKQKELSDAELQLATRLLLKWKFKRQYIF